MARGIAHREWRIHRDDYKTDEDFRGAVQAEFAMCENIGERLGVAIVAAPMRTRLLPDGEWFTAGWAFKTATVPAGREEPVEAPGEVESLEQALAAVPEDE
jgi:hypothetical protein